jgi:hypothetical protein
MCSVPAGSDHRRHMFGQAVRSMTQGASRALYDEVAFDRHKVTSAFFDASGVRIRADDAGSRASRADAGRRFLTTRGR